MSSAYMEGYNAAIHCNYPYNPYDRGTQEYNEWEDGYSDGCWDT